MYKYIVKRVRTFKRLVWVEIETFNRIVGVVREYEEKRLQRETRWREAVLSIEDQVLLMMMYLRSYTTYLYLWAIFGIHESNANRISRKIENIIVKSGLFALPKKKELLQEELEELLVDATEVKVSRPSKKQKRKYSGKKKMHTQKAQIIMNPKWRWRVLRTAFAEWRVHDKKLYDNSRVPMNKKAKKRLDSWYQGVQKSTWNVYLPHKWSKKHKLTKEQKKNNHELSKKRIKVENKICEIKVFEIFDERYRSPKASRFWLRFNLVCGIVNHNNGFWNF
jgi:hypothetical protein